MRNASTQRGYAPSVVAQVLAHLRPNASAHRIPWLVGLSALQGSGKSTLAAQCVAQANASGAFAISMSLDDFYLGRRARQDLARTTHPLFATRGVPGTHDIALLERTLDALAHASAETPARIPRFDKGRDTRAAPSHWQTITRIPDLVLLEGWCIAVPAQREEDLLQAVNALERDDDADGRWRRAVNSALASNYARVWKRLDRLIVLQAPDFDVVATWRDEQERALRERHAAQAMSPVALLRFIQHYERLSRHALASLHVRADVLIELDPQRNVVAISAAAPDAASCARNSRY